MNVEIGTETPLFLFWEYLFRNFGILSLQCKQRQKLLMGNIFVWMRKCGSYSICYSAETEFKFRKNWSPIIGVQTVFCQQRNRSRHDWSLERDLWTGFKTGIYGPWHKGVPLRIWTHTRILGVNSQTKTHDLRPFIIVRFCNHGPIQYISFPCSRISLCYPQWLGKNLWFWFWRYLSLKKSIQNLPL